jgi:hypothetical protein
VGCSSGPITGSATFNIPAGFTGSVVTGSSTFSYLTSLTLQAPLLRPEYLSDHQSIEFDFQNGAIVGWDVRTYNFNGSCEQDYRTGSSYGDQAGDCGDLAGSTMPGQWSSGLQVATSLPVGEAGTPYPGTSTAQLVSGGTPPYDIVVTGWPAGLAVDVNGNLSGTPAANSRGTYSLVVSATDSAGNSVGPATVQLVVLPGIVGTWYGSLQDTTYPSYSATELMVVQSESAGGTLTGAWTWLDGNWAGYATYPSTHQWSSAAIYANGNVSIVGQQGDLYTGTLSADGNTISGLFNQPGSPDAGTWTVSRTARPDMLSASNASGQVAGWVSGDQEVCTMPPCASMPYQSRVKFGPELPANGIITLGANYVADPSPITKPNEVVAFAQSGLPQYVSLPTQQDFTWTEAPDTIPVNFTPTVTVPIQFWDASTSPGAAQSVALLGIAFAADFYSSHQAGGTGINFSYSGPSTISGVPFNAVPGGAYSFVGCSDLLSSGVVGKARPPYSNMLNVYIVDVIVDPPGEPNPNEVGLSCGGAILLTTLASPDTLAHEIGHELTLGHTGQMAGDCSPESVLTVCAVTLTAGFTSFDLMYPVSGNLNPYLTSGQVFRTTFDSRSLLNEGAVNGGVVNEGGGLRAILNLTQYPVTLPGIFYTPLRSTPPSFTCDPLQAQANPSNPPQPQCPVACKDVWSVDAGAPGAACN